MLGIIGAQFLILAWLPVVLLLFTVLRPRRAVVAASIAAWVFLPPIGIPLPGIPDYTKMSATGLGIMLATAIFEPTRLLAFRPRWFDLPMLVFCLSPFVSSVNNGLGVYDGCAAAVAQSLTWLLPYWVGRLYLTDLESFREFGLGMIIGGLCLIPFCMVEFVKGQVITYFVFGFGNFEGTRLGGYRPRVFFQNGLELGLWMNAVTLVAFWFWRTGQFKHLWQIPSGMVFAVLLVITILCRSTGATFLLTVGFFALAISVQTKTKWALWGLLCIAPLFYSLRCTNLWSGESLIELARGLSEIRADSLDYRFENDDFLIAKALQQPYFGWGGWGRNRVFAKDGSDVTITDGIWIIVFGIQGFVGLISMNVAMLLPTALFLKRFPVEKWSQPSLAPVLVIATILGLFMIDCLLNGMINAVYIIAAGGLLNIVPTRPKLGTPDHDKLAMAPRSWDTMAGQYRARGRALKDQGQLVEAKAAWLNALDLYTKLTVTQPGDPAAHRHWCDCANDLTWLLVNAADPAVRDPALGLSLAVRTIESDPDCSTYWNTLGASYYRNGDFLSASAALDRSTTLGEGGTVFDYIFLAMTHARLGNREQAHRWFAEAMHSMAQHHPDHPELAGFCAEARALLSAAPATPADIH